MVEGLTFSATDQGSHAGGLGSPVALVRVRTSRQLGIEALQSPAPAWPNQGRVRSQPKPQSTHEILVTLAERPHPFPSRTRKLSSPAPKILRGQPFGKIGRRQDFCVSGPLRSAARPQRRVPEAAEQLRPVAGGDRPSPASRCRATAGTRGRVIRDASVTTGAAQSSSGAEAESFLCPGEVTGRRGVATRVVAANRNLLGEARRAVSI